MELPIATLLIGALILDRLVGDPNVSWHPVVLIGRYISFVESWLLKEQDSVARKRVNGLLLLIVVVGTVYTITELLTKAAYLNFNSWGIVFEMLVVSFTISPTALAKAGHEIAQYLACGDIENARIKVGWIVGRDTGNLDESEVSRATIETIAENITDGIVSPLFFALLGGAPLAFAYRAVNTLDSMVGYKNDKYLDFGRFSAKFDDVCNFIPARITGMLVVVASLILGYNYKQAWTIMWRDAQAHPSPNSGWAEAPVAGALGIRLGGENYYFGRASFRAYMGEAQQTLTRIHIGKTIKIMYLVSCLAVLIFSGVSSWVHQ